MITRDFHENRFSSNSLNYARLLRRIRRDFFFSCNHAEFSSNSREITRNSNTFLHVRVLRTELSNQLYTPQWTGTVETPCNDSQQTNQCSKDSVLSILLKLLHRRLSNLSFKRIIAAGLIANYAALFVGWSITAVFYSRDLCYPRDYTRKKSLV